MADVRHRLRGTLLSSLDLEGLDDGRLRRDLEGLLRGHVGTHGSVTESLGLHDTLHVGGPTELTGTDCSGGIDDLVRDNDFLDLVAKDLLEDLAESLKLLLLLLTVLLLLLGLLEVKVLGDVDELLAVVLLELSEGVLVDRVDKEENFKVLGLESIEEGGLGDGLEGFTSDVVHVLLVLGHASDVVLEGGDLVARLGGVEAEKLGKLGTVLRVLVDTELNVLGESSVELVELLTVLGDLVEHLEGLLDDVLADDLHDLVLLKGFTGQVEREILGVDDTLDEAEPLRDQVGSIVGDEDTANVELDVVLGTLGLEQIERGTLGNEEDSLELELTLNGEVLDGEVVFPVIGERLVERGVLLGSDIGGVPSPDGLGLVELFLLLLDLLNLLGLLLFLLIIIVNLATN